MSFVSGAFVSSLLPLLVPGIWGPFPSAISLWFSCAVHLHPSSQIPWRGGCLAPFWSSLLQQGFTGQETTLHIGKNTGELLTMAVTNRCVGDALLPVWGVPCAQMDCRALWSRHLLVIIRSCKGLDCNAAGLFWSYGFYGNSAKLYSSWENVIW